MMVTEKKENDRRKEVTKDGKPTIPAPKEEGEDPPASNALDYELHPSLANRWKHFTTNGIPKEEKDKLLEKYARRGGFEAPELSREIFAVLSESRKKRDEYLAETQRLIGSALVALGAAMSSLLNEQESIDKLSLLEKINDAAKLICEIHYRQTEFRKAVILARATERVKQFLSQTKSDTFLFGEDLSEKIKQFKALQKLRPKNSCPQNGRDRGQGHSGNSNCGDLQGRRLSEQNQAASSQSNNQDRPRLAFRSRQPFSPRRRTVRYRTR